MDGDGIVQLDLPLNWVCFFSVISLLILIQNK